MNPKKMRLRSLLGLPIALASFCVAAQTTTAEPPAGRLLASNCFQCHGYNGKSSIGFERLAGDSAAEIYKELVEMRTKMPPEMMDMHARGYTDAQARLIADYFSKVNATTTSTATVTSTATTTTTSSKSVYRKKND